MLPESLLTQPAPCQTPMPDPQDESADADDEAEEAPPPPPSPPPAGLHGSRFIEQLHLSPPPHPALMSSSPPPTYIPPRPGSSPAPRFALLARRQTAPNLPSSPIRSFADSAGGALMIGRLVRRFSKRTSPSPKAGHAAPSVAHGLGLAGIPDAVPSSPTSPSLCFAPPPLATRDRVSPSQQSSRFPTPYPSLAFPRSRCFSTGTLGLTVGARLSHSMPASQTTTLSTRLIGRRASISSATTCDDAGQPLSFEVVNRKSALPSVRIPTSNLILPLASLDPLEVVSAPSNVDGKCDMEKTTVTGRNVPPLDCVKSWSKPAGQFVRTIGLPNDSSDDDPDDQGVFGPITASADKHDKQFWKAPLSFGVALEAGRAAKTSVGQALRLTSPAPPVKAKALRTAQGTIKSSPNWSKTPVKPIRMSAPLASPGRQANNDRAVSDAEADAWQARSCAKEKKATVAGSGDAVCIATPPVLPLAAASYGDVVHTPCRRKNKFAGREKGMAIDAEEGERIVLRRGESVGSLSSVIVRGSSDDEGEYTSASSSVARFGHVSPTRHGLTSGYTTPLKVSTTLMHLDLPEAAFQRLSPTPPRGSYLSTPLRTPELIRRVVRGTSQYEVVTREGGRGVHGGDDGFFCEVLASRDARVLPSEFDPADEADEVWRTADTLMNAPGSRARGEYLEVSEVRGDDDESDSSELSWTTSPVHNLARLPDCGDGWRDDGIDAVDGGKEHGRARRTKQASTGSGSSVCGGEATAWWAAVPN